MVSLAYYIMNRGQMRICVWIYIPNWQAKVTDTIHKIQFDQTISLALLHLL